MEDERITIRFAQTAINAKTAIKDAREKHGGNEYEVVDVAAHRYRRPDDRVDSGLEWIVTFFAEQKVAVPA